MKKIITLAFLCTAFISKAQTTKSKTIISTNTQTFVTNYKSGKLKSQGNVVDNKLQGEWTYYYENGKVALKKNFVDGVPTGEWLFYNEKGELTMKVDDITKIDNGASISLIKDGKVVTTKKVTKEHVILKF